MKRFAVIILSLGVSLGAHAQTPGKFAWQDIGQRLKASQSVTPLGPDLSGEQVSLSNGALSFSATDVSLPGNSALPVAFSRSYVVKNRKDYYNDSISGQDMLADWSVDVPHISGVFGPDWVAGGATPGARCSDTTLPAASPANFDREDYWQGTTLHIPGGGDMLVARPGIDKPTTGGPYVYTTPDGQTHIACLGSIQNGVGEGFIATTADGTRYWFNRQAQHAEPDLKGYLGHEQGPNNAVLKRRKNVMLATRVEDRFGNYVTYTYTNAWNEPAKLTSIVANDGRTVTVTYSGTRVVSVSDGTHSWQYGYSTTTRGRTTLSSVTLPDASTWLIGFSAFTDAEIKYNEAPSPLEPIRICTSQEVPLNSDAEPVGTITHPAGATGTFTVAIKEHGRSGVTVNCKNVTTWTGYSLGTGNDTNDDINLWAISDYALTLKQKRLSGPGLTTADWNYTYEPNIRVFKHPGTTFTYPVCTQDWLTCNTPPCNDSNALTCGAGSSKTLVTAPDGSWTRYSYGNTWRYNEGKLLAVERGASSGSVMERTESTYDLSLVDKVYPKTYGDARKFAYDGFSGEYHRPIKNETIERGGSYFVKEINEFDRFARPIDVTKKSELVSKGVVSYSKREIITYSDNPVKWVMGQVSKLTTNNVEVVEIGYDTVTANQSSYESYNKPLQTLTYNADGTVATVKDGNNNVTTLSNWYRSVPRSIKHPATAESPTGATQIAVVTPKGWVTSVTDENGHVTGYGYDAMGRISSIVYPSADSTTWANTTQAFQMVGTTEYGIPAGHWRQTMSTGNGTRITYFDGQWRPLLTREYDAGNVSGTQRFQRFAYDAEGRTTFASYPGTTDALTTGSWSEYDALGRPTSSSQDSELGMLTTLNEYLSGFQTRVTPPKGMASPAGWQTTTAYKAYDKPTTDLPVRIDHPGGAVTVIGRNPLDMPLTLRRQDAANTLGVDRTYLYDGNQRLCRVVEPETGATLMGYDSNNNVAWSASGMPASSACDVNGGNTPAIAARKATRTYDARNRVTTLAFPDGLGNQNWNYHPDSLPSQITTYNQDIGSNVVNTYTYNKRRLLSSETQAQGAYVWNLGYGYNANGHLTSNSYPAGLSVDYAPNALGQATKATSTTQAFATGVTYHPNGAIAQFTYGNGLVHTMTQNARKLPLRSRDAYFVGAAALDDTYSYDGNGNVAAISDGLSGATGTRSMVYDQLDRLTSASSPMFGGGQLHQFTYDALDNMRSWTLAGVKDYANYVYSPTTNQLTNIKDSGNASVLGFGYDLQGNLDTKNGQTYLFDFGNRLRSAPNQETYRYDGHARRIWANKSGAGLIYSQYGQDGVLRWQRDERTSKRLQYVYLGGSLVAQHSRPIGSTTETVTYQHTDALGSPVAVTNASRVVIQQSKYEPYGKLINRPLTDGPGYTGHVQDAATGLTYMQQRYYDPGVGRFLSVDPVTANANTGAGFNRYVYAANNPYKFTDPDGRCEKVTGSNLCQRSLTATVSRFMLPAHGKTNMAKTQRSWPVPGHRKLNAADKPREGRGEFGSPRNTSRGRSTHTGIDIEARKGARVVAPQDGAVVDVRPNPSGTYGNQVLLDHGNGVFSQSAHLDTVSVKPGALVNGGQDIGTVGRTGNTPPLGDSHLHFEIRLDSPAPRAAGGTVVDPLPYLPEP